MGRPRTASRRGGRLRARPRRWPSRPRRTVTKPTGQIWPQKPLRKTRPMAMAASRIHRPAGCTGSKAPVARKRRRPSRALMGKKPSTPAGRTTASARPAATARQKRTKATPTVTVTRQKNHWGRRDSVFCERRYDMGKTLARYVRQCAQRPDGRAGRGAGCSRGHRG